MIIIGDFDKSSLWSDGGERLFRVSLRVKVRRGSGDRIKIL